MLVGGHVLVDGESTELEEGGGATDSVGGDYAAIEVANDEAERSALNANVKRCGMEADRGGTSARLNIDGLAARSSKDRPGSVLGESATGGNASAPEVVTAGVEPQVAGAPLGVPDLRKQIGQIPVDSFSVKRTYPEVQEAWTDAFWTFLRQSKLDFLRMKVGPLLRFTPAVDADAAFFSSVR